jgi:splicing factor 1
MSFRGGGITGSNNIPLGSRRRFGGDEEGSITPSAPATESLKRGRSPVRGKFSSRAFLTYIILTIQHR